MNRVILPVILLSVIAIAAGFAFAPVVQVTSVDAFIEQKHADQACQIEKSPDWAFNSTSGKCIPVV